MMDDPRCEYMKPLKPFLTTVRETRKAVSAMKKKTKQVKRKKGSYKQEELDRAELFNDKVLHEWCKEVDALTSRLQQIALAMRTETGASYGTLHERRDTLSKKRKRTYDNIANRVKLLEINS
jgi:hypothetical protein